MKFHNQILITTIRIIHHLNIKKKNKNLEIHINKDKIILIIKILKEIKEILNRILIEKNKTRNQLRPMKD